MEILRNIRDTQRLADRIRSEGKRLGFVPTMGALHVAHAALMTWARKENDFVIVSIFVNPTQFGPGEDFSSYPRTFEEDLQICEKERIDAVFYPEMSQMYTENCSTSINIENLTRTMCGLSRPGHFKGVATVVAKLFNIVKPHCAYFGQKDYQQFRVIEKMVKDLNFDLELIMCPIVRDEEGLAVSSRNRYLNEEQRKQAPYIYNALKQAVDMIEKGEKDGQSITGKITGVITENIPDGKIDYAGVYDALTLEPVENIKRDVVLAAAVWVGQARLIDNILVEK